MTLHCKCTSLHISLATTLYSYYPSRVFNQFTLFHRIGLLTLFLHYPSQMPQDWAPHIIPPLSISDSTGLASSHYSSIIHLRCHRIGLLTLFLHYPSQIPQDWATHIIPPLSIPDATGLGYSHYSSMTLVTYSSSYQRQSCTSGSREGRNTEDLKSLLISLLLHSHCNCKMQKDMCSL